MSPLVPRLFHLSTQVHSRQHQARMVKDSKMTDVTEKAAEEMTKKEEETEIAAAPVVPPLVAAAQLLERRLASHESSSSNFYTHPSKLVRRWLATSSGVAGAATASDISSAAEKLLPEDSAGRELLMESAAIVVIKEEAAPAMDTSDDAESSADEAAATTASIAKLVASAKEVEAWLLSLTVRLLWRNDQHPQAFALVQKGIQLLSVQLESSSIRSLFPLLARLYRFRSLVASSLPEQPSLQVDSAHAHTVATLRRDVDTQATLLNSMLRDMLNDSQIEKAQKLLSNSTFPELSSNNQLCRYLYYSGRIQALRLEYTSSFSNLSQCLRKAPTNTATGFRIAAQRLLIVVQLLMGEIPDRHVFFTKGMKIELKPYLFITQAVREGDLAVFEQVVKTHSDRLLKDGTFTLISRLAHQVVKAGLRKLHVSYSRLSLADVADRLGLPSAKSAEYVVAKAVRDGVLDATIHHDEGFVQSHDLIDVYATQEPAQAFHRRIAYCLTTHNDAVRGMRYPPDAYKKQLEASRGNRRKRTEEKSDEEKAQELEDEYDEDY